jgi:NAD(P)-dependent dehydrogenase (short-subunit alcohol dehydrogenase family)
MAGAWAGMRALAMSLAPKVLINAVGVGFVEEAAAPLAGDPLMPGHAGLSRSGRLVDIVNAVLFLADPANTYTTGQLLNVDGGWTVGYGRNF